MTNTLIGRHAPRTSSPLCESADRNHEQKGLAYTFQILPFQSPTATAANASFLTLDGVRSLFTGANTDNLLDRSHGYLPVPDLSSASSPRYQINDLGRLVISYENFDFDFRQEVHRVLRPAIQLRMAFLAPKTLDFTDGHSLDTYLREGILNLVELERLDYCFNHFHALPS